MRLAPGETVLFQGHPSWRAIIAFYIRGVVLTAILAALVAAATGLIGDGVAIGIVVLVALVGLGVTVLVGFIRRIATVYTVTSRRLHVKKGIVSREVQETRLSRVQIATYRQSFLERLLRVGTVDFDTAAVEDYEFRFVGVSDPADVVRKVDQAVAISDEDERQGLGTAGPR